jgi:hypothetical protein
LKSTELLSNLAINLRFARNSMHQHCVISVVVFNV